MNASIKKFLKEEDGVTALEYGLLAAVIAAVIVGAARQPIGEFFSAIFTSLKDAAETGISGAGTTTPA